MPKSLIAQLPEIVSEGRRTAEKILEGLEGRHRVSLHTRELVLPAHGGPGVVRTHQRAERNPAPKLAVALRVAGAGRRRGMAGQGRAPGGFTGVRAAAATQGCFAARAVGVLNSPHSHGKAHCEPRPREYPRPYI